jgi:hypothetical protein
MKTDLIVQEVHAIRKQLLDQAGGDLHRVVVLAHQARSPGRKIFTGQARKPVGWVAKTDALTSIASANKSAE